MTTQKATYKLGAGGRNPEAGHPFTVRDGVLGSDCSGFVRWCWQIDRYQPKWFPLYDGWINCDSLILAGARGAARLDLFARGKTYGEDFESSFPHDRFIAGPAYEALPGDAVVYPSIWKNDVRKRVGHEGIVVEVPVKAPTREEWETIYSNKDRANYLKGIKVIDCNASKWRRLKGKAIAETTAYAIWNKPDAVFVRFLGLP